MTNDTHPEELLAGYVDGSAAPDERRAVEAHLATCGRCREEVDLAMSSHAALASLPELAAPGVSAAVLKAARGSVGTKADAAPVAPSLDERVARRRLSGVRRVVARRHGNPPRHRLGALDR